MPPARPGARYLGARRLSGVRGPRGALDALRDGDARDRALALRRLRLCRRAGAMRGGPAPRFGCRLASGDRRRSGDRTEARGGTAFRSSRTIYLGLLRTRDDRGLRVCAGRRLSINGRARRAGRRTAVVGPDDEVEWIG